MEQPTRRSFFRNLAGLVAGTTAKPVEAVGFSPRAVTVTINGRDFARYLAPEVLRQGLMHYRGIK